MSQQGFLYEKNAYKALQKYKISTGDTAGASHDKPDLTVKSGSKTAGVELKNSPTAAGSLVMKYRKGKWSFGNWKGEVEKEFLHALAKKFNVLREMNSSGSYGEKWRGKIPHLQNDATGRKILVNAKNSQVAYKKDLKKFGAGNEVRVPIPASAICEYYIKKKCSYINVGTHGFFTSNNKDALRLNQKLKKNKLTPIPDFAESASAIIRVRCQYKGRGNYQFVMTLQFGRVQKSPYNIAPIRGKADIDTSALRKDPLLIAFRR